MHEFRDFGGRRLGAILVLGLLGALAVAVVRILGTKDLSWAANLTTVASFVLAALVAMWPFLRKLTSHAVRGLPLSDLSIAQAQDGLARVFIQQWDDEDRMRRLNDPWPIPVGWDVLDIGQEHLTGTFADIHEVFRKAPGQRLVILGSAGAGKSALAIKLTRELLKARPDGGALPVLLAAGTWTANVNMSDWIADQLVGAHPSLAVRVKGAAGDTVPLAEALAYSVLPIIDGLDELPESRRADVIAEINARGSDCPLVLTSRPAEYAAATAARPVPLAATIKLRPLATPEVEKYLEEATAAVPADRWQPVFAQIDAEPHGALAQALSAPLMLWLARTVYEQGCSDPAELADRNRLADRAAIEAHLLRALVPAVYSRRLWNGRKGFRCSPDQALRWSGFLAAHLTRTNASDIAWWRLGMAERGWLETVRAIRTVLRTCLVWWAAVWALTRRGYWHDGSYTGHGHYRDLLLAGPLGQVARPLVNVAVSRVKPSVTAALQSVPRHVADIGLPWTALLFAAVVLLMDWGSPPETIMPRKLDVRSTRFRRNALPFLLACLVMGLLWFLVVRQGPAIALVPVGSAQLVPLFLILIGIQDAMLSLRRPVDVSSAAGPVALLRGDRRAWVIGIPARVIFVALAWLWAGDVIAAACGAYIIAGTLVTLLLGGRSAAWPEYLAARLRLSVRRWLPWRAMTFLGDAHQRGVLRRSGATYQFRHALLQAQLAADHSLQRGRLALGVQWAARLLGPGLAILRDPQAPGIPSLRSAAPASARQWTSSESLDLDRLLRLAVVLFIVVAVEAAAKATESAPDALTSLPFIAVPILLATVLIHVLNRLRWQAVRSVRVTPGFIELTVQADTIRLYSDEVQGLALRPVLTRVGRTARAFALQARIRADLTLPFAAPEGWLPLYVLSDSEFPAALVTALDQFAGRQFDAHLARIRKEVEACNASQYRASGVGQKITVFYRMLGELLDWAVMLAVLADIVFLAIGWFLWAGLAAGVLVGVLTVCGRRLRRAAAVRAMPAGPWSLWVMPDKIELSASGHTVPLTRDDIEELDMKYTKGPGSLLLSCYAVQARLRPGLKVPFRAPGHWLTLYVPDGPNTDPPTELVAALHHFAAARLSASLRRRLREETVPVRRKDLRRPPAG